MSDPCDHELQRIVEQIRLAQRERIAAAIEEILLLDDDREFIEAARARLERFPAPQQKADQS